MVTRYVPLYIYYYLYIYLIHYMYSSRLYDTSHTVWYMYAKHTFHTVYVGRHEVYTHFDGFLNGKTAIAGII